MAIVDAIDAPAKQAQSAPNPPSFEEGGDPSSFEDEAEQTPKTEDDIKVKPSRPEMDIIKENLRTAGRNISDVGAGAIKTAGQTVNTVSGLLNKIPGIGETLAPKQGVTAATQLEKPTNTAQEIGGGLETIGEFMLGDEALKGITLGGKLMHAGKIAESLEQFPRLRKALEIGMNFVRHAATGDVQSLAHGQKALDAIKTGVVSGVVGTTADLPGAASTAMSGTTKDIAQEAVPKTAQIAGESVPVSSKLAGADVPELATAQQAAGQKVIGNLATEAAGKHVGEFGVDVEKAGTFGDAANQIKQAAQPIFKELDKVSNGEFAVLQKQVKQAQRIMWRANSIEDLNAAEQQFDESTAKIDELFNKAEGRVVPQDLAAAKSAWRDTVVLNKLHGYVDKAYSIPQAEADLTGKARTLDLKALRSRLSSFTTKNASDLQRVLGPEGFKSLSDLADLGAEKTVKMNQLIDQVTDMASKGFLRKSVGDYKAIRQAAVRAIYTNPRLGQLATRALKAGKAVKDIAPAVANAWQLEAAQPEESQ